ncbi:MAG TPA: type VI secretion system tube protein TssD [Candidatus Saccharimonadales bacterium]|nr:type VI secretion system tube protein TssD [Candidatus Saccharimonadales bacterium]
MPLRQIAVEIDGKKIANVVSVKYGLEVRNDSDGSPSDARPRLARITLARKSDDSALLFDWASKPFRGNFKSGKVTFYAPDEETKVQSTMTWTDGFVTMYQETVPNIQTDRQSPMLEYIEISAQKIKINDVEVAADSWA